MLGFSKKKNKEKKQEQKTIAQINIPEDKFTVMPKQYLPHNGAKIQDSAAPAPAGSKINKKFLILGGGALAVLIILIAILYFVFSSKEETSAPIAQAPDLSQPSSSAPADDSKDEEDAIKEKILSTQAYNSSNILIGSLEITVPATVVQEFGTGIGITALEADDLTLPEKGTILGGLYSAYPSGVSFDEALSIEIIASDIPAGVSQADVYPAYLRGVKWQEFDDYQAPAGITGFVLALEKLPTGPIAVIWNPEQDEDGSQNALEFTKAVPSIDTDEDGLTDKEEQMIGTSYSSADSDEDTYADLEEILNGYNPVLGDGSKLEESGIFAVYTNTTYGYQVQYPSQWLADSLDQTNKQVLFISETEEFFEILIEENPLNTPIVDWYRGQSPSLKSIELDVTVIGKRPAVWSPDGLTLYSSKDGLIYILTYNRGTRDEISWPNMFEYFYNSFVFGNTSNGSGDDTRDSNDENQDTGTTTPDSV